ncbi:MAG: CAAX prenyl protease-related protein [Akkermansia sp.]|nr:CAAX prenyl protease-related protein [Akkermansia sp.]MBQ6942117.1 CAAX prenyl protease-related protein [Akkermansia sp.]
MQTDSSLYRSCVYPLAIFMAFSILLGVGGEWIEWKHPEAAWWQQAPEMLVYPLQTLVCGWWLWHVRREIEWDWNARACGWGVLFGLVGIGLWLVPYFAGWIPNTGGFEPERIFGAGTAATYAEYSMRFARAVIVVPLAEELFWRGFLMRWCVNRDFPQSVAAGTPSRLGYVVTTAAFMFIHNPVDYAGAFCYGSLAYLLVVKTKRITPAIIMHAVANAIMGTCAVGFDMPQLW